MEQTDSRQLRKSIQEQRERIRRNSYTPEEAEAALEHHLEQLKKLGATLEDDICSILRKSKELAEASQRLEELLTELELRTMRGEI
jgi:septal ring factor EnvC (AmiA/AmiB activator)